MVFTNCGQRQLKKEHETVNCIGCRDELNADHLGIKCVQGHSMCTKGCALQFCNLVLSEPDEYIPLKCTVCRADVIISSFERQLNPKQYQLFLFYVMSKDVSFIDKNTEEIVSCPYCNYWEINEINDGRMMIHCKSKKCKKISCYHCKKAIKAINYDNSDDNNDDNKEYEINVDSFEEHYICASLAYAKAIWDKALAYGVKRACPECGLGGIKNNACMFIFVYCFCLRLFTIYDLNSTMKNMYKCIFI